MAVRFHLRDVLISYVRIVEIPKLRFELLAVSLAFVFEALKAFELGFWIRFEF